MMRLLLLLLLHLCVFREATNCSFRNQEGNWE
jgi:hypothetical protein